MGAFHEGEQALQAQAGVRERFAAAGAPFLRDFMPEQHREFFPLLPFLLVGSVDASGQPHASVLSGPPGFARSPDPRVLDVRAWPQAHDPLAQALHAGAPIALLGLQPHTRRRNRLNGHVMGADGRSFLVHVDQSFGNCPKYIQAREPHFTGARNEAPRVTHMRTLDAAAQRLVRNADTLFIASAHPRALGDGGIPEHGVDVSHRGGKPGFVRVDEGAVLTLPDFTGNSYFNTLGNLLLEPRCGLLFIDYDGGDTLQVTARAGIVTEGQELASFRGALRLVRFEVTGAVRTEGAVPLRWGPAEMSPVLENTGTW
jgi:predicted pyridoxine 5'-phosphate oxidase superfamily flavin-nucleotide-binding protein